MEIREFLPDDLERAAAVWLTANVKAGFPDDEAYWLRKYRAVWRRRFGGSDVLLAEDRGDLCGLAAAEGGLLWAFCVGPAFSGRGTGTLLLSGMKARRSSLRVLVPEENRRAAAFFLKNGFAETGRAADAESGLTMRELAWTSAGPGEERGGANG